MPTPYTKPWLPVTEQATRLENRGLKINDRPKAESFLRHVNYYRLAGFCLAFENPQRQFSTGATFDDLQDAYRFDTSLRDLFGEALEAIEIDLCTSVALHFGEKYGAFGHTDETNFHQDFGNTNKKGITHASWLGKLHSEAKRSIRSDETNFHQNFGNTNKKGMTHASWLGKLHSEAKHSKELFTQHFKNKYNEFPNLPVWTVTETMTFGSIAHMIRGMRKQDRQAIALEYQITAQELFALTLHLNYVRNLCAHHSRLWDRKWSIKPTLPENPSWKNDNRVSNDRLFSTLLLMWTLLQRSDSLKQDSVQWKERIKTRLRNSPQKTFHGPTDIMGLTKNWESHPAWH